MAINFYEPTVSSSNCLFSPTITPKSKRYSYYYKIRPAANDYFHHHLICQLVFQLFNQFFGLLNFTK